MGYPTTKNPKASRVRKAVSVELSPGQFELLDKVCGQVPLLTRHRLVHSIVLSELARLRGHADETLRVVLEHSR